MLDIPKLFIDHEIIPRGVIHVGAHEGQEFGLYRAMGFKRILFIEANPDVYHRLCGIIGDVEGVGFVHCAVTDHDGECDLHVMTNDQSSSILEPRDHLTLYPSIQKTHTMRVPCRTLTNIMKDIGEDPANYNYLHMDIQGAEMKALEGAKEIIPYMEAITSEVNFRQMYEGCTEFDAFSYVLDHLGFKCSQTDREFGPDWGDAFYVRPPEISMRCLGKLGRFGNSLFQFIFAKIMDASTPEWIGDTLFDPPINRTRAIYPSFHYDGWKASECPFVVGNFKSLPARFDMSGFFQFHTSYYKPYQHDIRALLTPRDPIRQHVNCAWNRLTKMGQREVIAVHLRRGDYTSNDKMFYTCPDEWYIQWIRDTIKTCKSKPVVYIASDDPLAHIAYAEFNPVSMRDIMPIQNGKPLIDPYYFLDFSILARAHHLAISNSSFSMMAAMLNENARTFVRPDLTLGLVPFDPWNAEVLLGRGGDASSVAGNALLPLAANPETPISLSMIPVGVVPEPAPS